MTSRRLRMSSMHVAACAMALVTLQFAGCQRSEYPLVQVSGTVTFDGGSCPAPGNVTFQPLEIREGLPKRPASGRFGRDGRYAVNTFSNNEGVLPGRYRVEVTCFAGVPDPSKPDPWGAVNYIAEKYKPAELTIEPDSPTVIHNLDVPRRVRPGS